MYILFSIHILYLNYYFILMHIALWVWWFQSFFFNWMRILMPLNDFSSKWSAPKVWNLFIYLFIYLFMYVCMYVFDSLIIHLFI